MFFQGQLLSLNFFQFLELMPFLILALSFGLAVLGAGLKLEPRFFKLMGLVGFGLAAFFWTLILLNGKVGFLGVESSPLSRSVGAMVCLFGVLSFSVFDMADRYFAKPEWLALSFLSALGLCLLPISKDWVSFFVFLETFSIPAYVLVAYDYHRERSLESSLKYLLSGAFASALLLMGVALLYLASGSIDYVGLSSNLSNTTLSSFGILLILAGILFKLTAVPFHFWAPDVYQGAPTGVAAFLASATKLSVFCAGAIAFKESGFSARADVLQVAVLAAGASALVGSFLAYTQRSFRRMMAYSGTVNAGILLPLMVSGQSSLSSGFFFLCVYGVTIVIVLSSFASLMKSRGVDENEDLNIDSFSALDGQKSSTATLVLAACMISMAGIPPFPGFIAKYWAYSDLWQAGHKGLVTIALVATLMGVAYYIRIAGKFFFSESKKAVTH
ncbi:MAG: NADH-quinone oxidoreductase subunit N [Bdellovibrionota bacterium]